MVDVKLQDYDSDPLERTIESKVCVYAKRKGVWNRKFQSQNVRGVPDRIFMYKGRVFFVEFKRKGRKPTALQQKEISLIVSHGGEVYVIDNIQDGKDLIDKIVEGT